MKNNTYSIICMIILGFLNFLLIMLCNMTFIHYIDNSEQMNNINISGTIEEYPHQNIIDNYLKVTESLQQLLEHQLMEEERIDPSDLNEIQDQITDLTDNVININNKIDQLSDEIKTNYNSNVISSIITGLCTIIAALITAKSVIKVIVYQIRNEDKNKHKKHKK